MPDEESQEFNRKNTPLWMKCAREPFINGSQPPFTRLRASRGSNSVSYLAWGPEKDDAQTVQAQCANIVTEERGPIGNSDCSKAAKKTLCGWISLDLWRKLGGLASGHLAK